MVCCLSADGVGGLWFLVVHNFRFVGFVAEEIVPLLPTVVGIRFEVCTNVDCFDEIVSFVVATECLRVIETDVDEAKELACASLVVGFRLVVEAAVDEAGNVVSSLAVYIVGFGVVLGVAIDGVCQIAFLAVVGFASIVEATVDGAGNVCGCWICTFHQGRRRWS